MAMKSQRGPTSSWKRFVIAAAFVAGVMPGVALADDCASGADGMITGVLTETMESPPAQAAPGGPLLAGTFPPGQGVRLAQATENGVLANGCGSLISLEGQIVVHAQSRVALTSAGLGTGPIGGTFSIATETGNISGKLTGTLDFTPTNNNVPIVYVNDGFWSTQGPDGLQGGFSGVALVPFPCGGETWCYYDPTGVLTADGKPGYVFLDPASDFDQHGSPEAKFIITLFQ
jgi:hypothetical protein